MPLTAGTRLGHYSIVSAIGEGGMGEVYLAEDARLRRRVALKVLPAHLTSDEAAGKRLLREARCARLGPQCDRTQRHIAGRAVGELRRTLRRRQSRNDRGAGLRRRTESLVLHHLPVPVVARRWLVVLAIGAEPPRQTLVLPLQPGHAFPEFPLDDSDAVTAWKKLPTTRLFDRPETVPGLDQSTYVVTKVEERRNLFRVPLPP